MLVTEPGPPHTKQKFQITKPSLWPWNTFYYEPHPTYNTYPDRLKTKGKKGKGLKLIRCNSGVLFFIFETLFLTAVMKLFIWIHSKEFCLPFKTPDLSTEAVLMAIYSSRWVLVLPFRSENRVLMPIKQATLELKNKKIKSNLHFSTTSINWY